MYQQLLQTFTESLDGAEEIRNYLKAWFKLASN
jgi:hypothetical protein